MGARERLGQGGLDARLLLVLGLACAACRGPGAFTALPPDDPRPGRLLSAFEAQAEARHSLRGRARVEVESGDGRNVSGRQIVVAERPNHLRLELLGLFDQSLAVLAVDGDRYEFFRAGDLSFEAGELRDDLLWQHARIALRPEEAIALLLGAPLPEPGLVPVRAGESGTGELRVSLAPPGGRERRRLGFDAEGRLRAVEVLRPDGEPAWSARYGEYQPVSGVPFAHEISLAVAEGETRVRIALRDVELNPELPGGIFHVRPAAGAGDR